MVAQSVWIDEFLDFAKTYLTEAALADIQDQLELLARQLQQPIQFGQYTIAIKAHIDVIFTDNYKDLESCEINGLQNSKATAILENSIKLLLQLNVKIVAEGVETKEMATYLDNHGVTHLQGYYYSQSISEAAYYDFLIKDRSGGIESISEPIESSKNSADNSQPSLSSPLGY